MVSTTLQALKNNKPFARPTWAGEEGMRNLLRVSIPLILTSSVHSVNLFVDRTLLSWYSSDAFNAAFGAGVIQWTVLVLFLLTVQYAGTFVAQLIGAKENHSVGPIVWQSVYLALFGGAILTLLAPIGYPLFRWIGHEGNIPLLEAQYFKILVIGSVFPLLSVAGQTFFMGQERTGLILFINIACAVLNLVLDVWLIFEPVWIFPEGIMGAAWATNIANGMGFVLCLLFAAANWANERTYRIFSGWRPNKALMLRLLRFGFPSGVHGVIDMVGFGTFMTVVGMFGASAQFASNMAFNVNLLLFIPAIGVHSGVQIITGRLCGMGAKDKVVPLATGAAAITFVYMVLVCIAYIAIPGVLLGNFRGSMPAAQWTQVFQLATVLLLFVAAYSTFDAFVLVYSGALKGAGDTQFVMWVSLVFSQLLLTGPCLALAAWRHHLPSSEIGLYLAWTFCSFYIVFLSAINFGRFWTGHWRKFNLTSGHGDPPPLVAEPVQVAPSPMAASQGAEA